MKQGQSSISLLGNVMQILSTPENGFNRDLLGKKLMENVIPSLTEARRSPCSGERIRASSAGALRILLQMFFRTGCFHTMARPAF